MAHDEQSSDPIEELFREKAGEYDISYNEADWLKLEQRLDNREAQRSRVNRWRWIAAACVLIIALLSYFTYQNYQAIDRLNQQLAEEMARNQADEGSDDIANNRPDMEQNNTPVIAGADSTEESQSQPPQNQENQQILTESASNQEAQVSETGETAEIPATATTEFAVSEQMGRNLFTRDYFCPGCLFAGGGFAIPTTGNLASSKTSLLADSEEPLLASATQYSEPAEEASSPNTVIRYSAQSRLSVGLAAGPDLSTVGGFSNFAQPGYKIGLSAEYQLTDRLAVSAGIGRSRVYYSVQNFNYTTGSGYNSSSTLVPHTDADCAILDIPITLKYDFLQLDQSRLFASAGLSSYIMLNEEYRFNYYGNADNRPQQWSSRTGKSHWMSNLNISVGYELDLGPDWSIRAEPFAKIPVREVGWGQVELFSLGTSVSLNYRL